MILSTKTARPGDPDLLPAGFWLRFFAYILDFYLYLALIGLMVWAVVLSAGAALLSYMEKNNFDKLALQELGNSLSPYSGYLMNSNVIILIVLSPAILYILYYSLFEASFLRATPGKLALGLVVTDPQDQRVRFGTALTRNVYKFLPNFIPIGALLVLLFAVKILPVLFLFAPIIAIGSLVASLLLYIVMYGSAGWTEEKQGLHDKWTYSYVQKKISTSRVQRQGFSLLAIALFSLSIFKGYITNDSIQLRSRDFSIANSTQHPSISKSSPTEKNFDMSGFKEQVEEVIETTVQKKKQKVETTPAEMAKNESQLVPDFPSDSQEKSLQILKRGKEIDLGGVQNSTTQRVEERPVLHASASGFVGVGKTAFQIMQVKASLREGGRIVEALVYGKNKAGVAMKQPLMKMYFSYKTNTGNCFDKHLQSYLVKINAQFFGIAHVKKGEFLTFTRRGGDIQLNEKVKLSCQRNPDGGWVRINGISKEAALLYGVRYPVRWEVNLEDRL